MRSFFLILTLLVLPQIAHAQEIVDMTFPVDGTVSFQDDFLSPRSSGRLHHATDILAAKMTPVVAVVEGTITYAPMDQPSYGYMLTLRGDNGYSFSYIHLNNDTPGTDDGMGGTENAYASGIERGVRVTRGEHIAWVGDSGNAESTVPHLHFEIEDPDQIILNPYPSLQAALSAVSYDPAVERSLATTISVDKDLPFAETETGCAADALIKTPEVSAVYYCGRDNGRYVFQNEDAYFSWYTDFSSVQLISTEEMATIPLKGVVTYRPGVYLVKMPSVPKVYAVARNGTLRGIPSPAVAASLYGSKWSTFVKDLPETFFPRYTVGEDVVSSSN